MLSLYAQMLTRHFHASALLPLIFITRRRHMPPLRYATLPLARRCLLPC